ncbi:hypothetical protein ABL78_2002 [Leptomonas seymouri]|uniref:Uncharacterized protein n=1 Tax=Leptomonas seymouri TaxID=5684 RepID=A0A0N1I9T8_LEPSE|nr:hypothetical protein ABL78_2002 [Leptomonas seymouri]|eukprot:KPI88885.1 hypothetical protein ABL78_2002 [Leptomonas seymouri]
MSSDTQKAKRTKQKSCSTAHDNVYVLPREAELIGRCWLLASTASALSPSRWFALSYGGMQGARSPDRRAFSISSAVLSPSARDRQPVLRDLGINIHKGLTACGYENISIASINALAAQQKRSIRVGGVHIDLPRLPQNYDDGFVRESCYIVIAVRRVSVESELREYATASYTRHVVKAPPVNDEERLQYGEGCLTGLLYGAAVVLHVPERMRAAARLVKLCGEAGRGAGVLPSALQVQEETAFGVRGPVSAGMAAPEQPAAATGEVSPHCPWYVHLLSVLCESAFERELVAALERAELDKTSEVLSQEDTLRLIAEWVVRVHQNPSAWSPINAFLQRYEAIADSLLLNSKKP